MLSRNLLTSAVFGNTDLAGKMIIGHYHMSHKTVYVIFRVSLEDLYNGKTSKLQLSKTVICSKCNG